jgi:hypothetical protein
MTTEPIDDTYPEQWKPRERLERDRALDPSEVEVFLSSLSDVEFSKLVLRTRGQRP